MVNTSIQDVFYLFEEEFAKKLSNKAIFLYLCRKYIELCTTSDCQTKRF